MKKSKPQFEKISHNPTLTVGVGNKAGIITPMATFVLDEEKYNEHQKAEWEKHKAIYENHVNIGQQFASTGSHGTGAVAEIWRIDWEKQIVYWRQTKEGFAKDFLRLGIPELKPAKGKFSINGLINLHFSKSLKFI